MIKLQEFSDPVVVQDNIVLQSIVTSLLKEEYVTIDTEFVRERTYWPELCLIQIAGKGYVYLIDVLAEGIDLTLLLPLLSSPTVCKVFHAAQQDLEIFLHLFKILPNPIFDTQIAAMVAGFGNQIGYDSLVDAVLGYKIDKSHRFSDWSMRPLTNAQYQYAAADVTYLWCLYPVLSQKLQETGRETWVISEMETLSDPNSYLPSIPKMWKRLRPRTNNRRLLGCLYAVLEWREQEAQRLNIPRQHLLRDETLLAISVSLPDSIKALSKVRGVSRGFAEGKEGELLLEVIKRVKNISVDDLPVPVVTREGKKPPEELVSLLKVLLTIKCEEYQVAPKLLASSKDIEDLLLEKKELPILSGWRYEIFGKDAVDLCNGKLILGIQKNKIELIRR